MQADVTGTDRYGRSLAWISADNVKVNQRRIADGWAWHFMKYNSDYGLAAPENEASVAGAGLDALLPPPNYLSLFARVP